MQRRVRRLGQALALSLSAGSLLPGASALAQTARAPIVVPAVQGAGWPSDDLAKLQADLDALLAAPALRGAHVGLIVRDPRGGATLYERNADDAFQPASTLKLVVGSAALDRLGDGFRFRTDAFVTPQGAVILRAGGDPLLAESDIEGAAQAIAATGLRIARGVYIDDSHFDLKPYADGWTWDDFAYDYAPRASAMALEENVAHLTVAPGAAIGTPALVRAAPVGAVVAAAADCEPRGRGVVVVDQALTGAAHAESSADVALDAGGCIEAVGSVPLGGPPSSVDAAVPDPVLYAREALVQALQRAGVALDPQVQNAVSDATVRRAAPAVGSLAPVWSHLSPLLGDVLGPRFWIPSDNFFGELLLKELGFAASAGPGTTARGSAAEKSWLQSIGVDPASVELADGCGVSQYDRITPRDLAIVLQHDWNGPYRDAVLGALPVGGARGTIEGIAGTDAAGRVFAKTGSLMHVRGLAGYLATKRHGAVIFSLNVDDWLGAHPALVTVRAQILSRLIDD